MTYNICLLIFIIILCVFGEEDEEYVPLYEHEPEIDIPIDEVPDYTDPPLEVIIPIEITAPDLNDPDEKLNEEVNGKPQQHLPLYNIEPVLTNVPNVKNVQHSIQSSNPQRLLEIAAGKLYFPGHYKHPDKYNDFNRRYVDLTDKGKKALRSTVDTSIVPKRAPPELVLHIAKQSAILEAAKPVDPREEILKENALRSGQYWDSVWTEPVDPLSLLRDGDVVNLQDNNVRNKGPVDMSIIPKKASPELVLHIAKQSAILEAAKPVDPMEELLKENALRTGQYWDSVWTEPVDPLSLLRDGDVVDNNVRNKGPVDMSIIPKKASPELVLKVAKDSAILEAAKPVNPSEELIRSNALRTGNYWNSVWTEEVNPKALLRDGLDKLDTGPKQFYELDTIKLKLKQGSQAQKVLSQLTKLSPRLLYIIKKNKYVD